MRRLVKSIAAALMAVVMLMAISTTAMAAEQVSDQHAEAATGTPAISVQSANRLVGYWQGKVSVKQGACIGTVNLDSGAVRFEALATKSWGGSGVINVKFYCPETGVFRVGTIPASGVLWQSGEWVNSMPAGTYQILVENVNPAATYNIKLSFYAR